MATTRSHVTKREAQAVCDYASNLCDLLGMPTWRILVMDDPCDDDEEANASISWIDQRYVAQLWLGSTWMKVDYNDRREVITHEVLHLLHSKVSTVVLDDSKAFMHDHEHDDWSRRVRREFELMVDHIAGFLAKSHTLEQSWDAAHGR